MRSAFALRMRVSVKKSVAAKIVPAGCFRTAIVVAEPPVPAGLTWYVWTLRVYQSSSEMPISIGFRVLIEPTTYRLGERKGQM